MDADVPGVGPPGALAPKTAEVQDPVHAAIEGDLGAVERLLAAIRPLVVRYCRFRIALQDGSYISADDVYISADGVAQEVLLAVLAALPSYRDDKSPFLAFVYGTAAHKVADAKRAAARNRSEPIAELPDCVAPDAEPEAHVLACELNNRVSSVLQLPPSPDFR